MASFLDKALLAAAPLLAELTRSHGYTLPGVGKVEASAYDLLALLGALYVGAATLRVLFGALAGVVGSFTGRSLRSYGSWAVVTGATDGIGKAYAKALAKRGLNVVLISRTPTRLAETAAEIKAKAGEGVQIKTIAADFSADYDSAAYSAIARELEGLDIGVLINNVGASYPSALYFHELEEHAPGLTKGMINMNVVAVTRMTAIVLPGMLQRKRGAIVNISSAAGRVPIGNPLYAEYSASKAYVDFFSRSLHYEYAAKGVSVQCVSPYFVTSKLSKLRHASLFTPSPDSYAAAAVASIGRGGASIVPYWPHAVQDWVLQRLPHWLLARQLVPMHLGMRKRFLAKQAAPAAAAPVSGSERKKHK
jgi:17beta-estradiol 17-dehydrogenase / very-long-chain 3-oxoacyl-CoA reductase